MKTYLKDLTPDEVIRRLKSGEEVKNAVDDTESYKFLDGFIVKHNDDGYILSCYLWLGESPLYFETPDELKLEVGKCYKTRDGRKAFISTYDSEKRCFRGVIAESFDFYEWEISGDSIYSAINCGVDLISEWSDDDVAED